MSKEYSLEELKNLKSKTDVKRFNETSEKDIMEQTIADPDLPNLTEKELKEFKQGKGKSSNEKD
ncbi:hypothetical protein [Teredinibacter haidensis]|uniref:hypothetical protein n=1 Tax=Teredinibacter haidensis TaxID=2731755 RepID=UPI000948C7D8|nr:hypothetical protein [Teredinibacter haidensis]